MFFKINPNLYFTKYFVIKYLLVFIKIKQQYYIGVISVKTSKKMTCEVKKNFITVR